MKYVITCGTLLALAAGACDSKLALKGVAIG